MDRDDPAYKGQAGYNPFLLAIYDPFVLGFMARVVWRCPTPPVVERYRLHLERRHLDVGPGTGYFVEHAAPPAGTEVTLLDPNPNVLARSSHRLVAMHPTIVQADVMKPCRSQVRSRRRRSTTCSTVCADTSRTRPSRSGTWPPCSATTACCWAVRSWGTSERHTPQARAILWAFNRKGDFDNLGDTADGLRNILEASFRTVEIDVIGSIAHFTATGPRRAR